MLCPLGHQDAPGEHGPSGAPTGLSLIAHTCPRSPLAVSYSLSFCRVLCGGHPTTVYHPHICAQVYTRGTCRLGRAQISRKQGRRGQEHVPNRHWEARTCMIEASKSLAHAPLSHQASCIEHKVKDQINNNCKMATTQD